MKNEVIVSSDRLIDQHGSQALLVALTELSKFEGQNEVEAQFWVKVCDRISNINGSLFMFN